MALIVEDGTGLTGAESYASVEQADDYLSKRNRDSVWATYTTAQKEGFLRAATEYLDAMCTWRGLVQTTTQSLGWPRTGAYDRWDRPLASSEVPFLVAWATIEVASLGAITREGTPSVTRKVVGPLEVEYDTAMDRSVGRSRYKLAFDLIGHLSTSSGAMLAMVRA